MEAFEAKPQQLDDQQQHLDTRMQSHPSTDSDELVVQALTHEFETLVLSCNHDGFDRDRDGYSSGIEDDDHTKQPIDDEVGHLEPKEPVDEAEAESSYGTEEKNYRDHLEKVVEADPEECRVLDEREVDESEIGGENQYEQAVDDEEEEDLKENQEIEIAGGDETGDFENNGEQRGSYRAYEHYPLRPDAEDCAYYMRTGMCKYGSNCKFNHPLRKNNQPNKDSHRQKEENMDMHGQIECKYYLSTAGCKYGKSCKYIHSSRGKAVITPVLEYNFLGLPIRPGEKECPYYMRNGSCKYGPNCRFNHPDPAAASVDAPATYGKDGLLPLQPPPQPNIPGIPTWSGPRTPDPTSAFVPVMYPPAQNMPPRNPDWNSYQGPAPVPAPVPTHVYPSSDRGLPIPPAFFLNSQPADSNMYTHRQQTMVVSEYPERPGQPDCSYFMKTGDCKYRSSCKFHHPKSRITRSTPSVLSDKGLPLRPDQNVCTYYSRYGICKYGPACKYDHPVNYNINSGEGGYDGSGRSGSLIQSA